MRERARSSLVTLPEDAPVWERTFTVNPLVLIGTKERDGDYDLAPKHMAMPMGWENYFGSCAPRATGPTITPGGRASSPSATPDPCRWSSRALRPRHESDGSKLAVDVLPTFPASEVDGLFIEDAYLFLECVLDRISDDFGENSLIVGRIVAAHVREDYLRASERDEQDLIHSSPLLAYLSPGRYASVDELLLPIPCRLHAVAAWTQRWLTGCLIISAGNVNGDPRKSGTRGVPRPSRGRRKKS